jgi:hypothetical protein
VSAHVNQNISNIDGLDISPENYTFIGFKKEFFLDA